MRIHINLFTVVILLSQASGVVSAPGKSGPGPAITNQLVENRVSPVGLDADRPRFSWQLEEGARGLRQTAYHLEVTSGAADASVMWDSGWVDSDQSVLVPYAGKPLRSSTPNFWRVQIKDENGVESPWSESARWVTGLLDAEKELRADWIGFDQPAPETPHGSDWFDLDQAEWISNPDLKPHEEAVAFYRTKFTAPADTARVMVGMAANFAGQMFINGIEVFQAGKIEVPRYLDITPWIRPGQNELAFRINHCEPRKIPALIAAVRIEHSGGQITRTFTDATWETTLKKVDLWADGGKLGDGWKAVKVLGKPGALNRSDEDHAQLPAPKFNNKTFMPPPVCLRHEIELSRPVRFAVFHGTAEGLYDLHVNGWRMTPTGFQPGWTQYEKRIDYVSTDVTAALKAGRNAIGVVLADGWFRGNELWMGRENFAKAFGDKIRFSGQLEVEYADGTRETFRTDPTWKASYGPMLQADIYNGEIYDARREQAGWDRANFNDANWKPVIADPRPSPVGFVQRAHPTETVRSEMELPPQKITEPKPGIYVLDFGQNLAGWTRLKINGRPGQNVYLRFGEDLNPDGMIYTDNLRSVNPADRYVCKGGEVETWEPRFTYHGFRYVQVAGLAEKPGRETLTSIVAHSGGPILSTFESSSPMLNRLYKNIQWSQRGNYFETMTDCPQRDERYGWVGDAHFFMASAAYNQNAASFMTKWFADCVDTQKPKDGNISNGAPGYRPGGGNASMDWSAAMMITPWMIWQCYGDPQPIREHYAALRLYMTQWEKLAASAKGGKAGKSEFRIIGDWVTSGRRPSTEFVSRYYGYLMCSHMADCARITGHDEDVRKFTDLAAHFRSEIIRNDIHPNGTVDGDMETAYAVVCRYHLYEPAQEKLIREKFQKRMVTDQYCTRVGFLGAGNLLQGLSAIGLNAAAARAILNEESPSWGNMVKLGATTIWEHWDGKNADSTFPDPKMNSFNHYTFGGCGEWLMGYLAGLRAETPGFKVVHVEPVIIPDLDFVDGSFQSPYGRISNRWERKAGRITMRLVIPPNSSARVILPSQAKAIALEGNVISAAAPGGMDVGSGTHEFAWKE